MDGINIPISGDASKAEAAFEKMKAKVNSLVDTIEKMRQKNKIASEGMIVDYKGVATSIEKADLNMAKLQNGVQKMKFATLKAGATNDLVFPKMTKQINQAESATSSLISRTLSYSSAVAAVTKGLSLYIQYAKEMRDLGDSLTGTVSNSSGRANISGNVPKDKQGYVQSEITSLAERSSTSIEKSGKFTEKLLSAGVTPENIKKYKSGFKAITSTKSDDAGGLAESIMSVLSKDGINANDATEEQISNATGLIAKTFGLESSQAYNSLSGSNDKVSNIENFALISLAKEKNAGNIRKSVSKVNAATTDTKGKVTDKTLKILGIKREDYDKRKNEIGQDSAKYLDETFSIAASTTEAQTEKAKTRDAIVNGQNVGPNEEQRAIYNREYNKSTGSKSIIGWGLSSIWSQEEAYEFEDRFRTGGADKKREEFIMQKYNESINDLSKAAKTNNLYRSNDLGKTPTSTKGDSK